MWAPAAVEEIGAAEGQYHDLAQSLLLLLQTCGCRCHRPPLARFVTAVGSTSDVVESHVDIGWIHCVFRNHVFVLVGLNTRPLNVVLCKLVQ